MRSCAPRPRRIAPAKTALATAMACPSGSVFPRARSSPKRGAPHTRSQAPARLTARLGGRPATELQQPAPKLDSGSCRRRPDGRRLASDRFEDLDFRSDESESMGDPSERPRSNNGRGAIRRGICADLFRSAHRTAAAFPPSPSRAAGRRQRAAASRRHQPDGGRDEQHRGEQ